MLAAATMAAYIAAIEEVNSVAEALTLQEMLTQRLEQLGLLEAFEHQQEHILAEAHLWVNENQHN